MEDHAHEWKFVQDQDQGHEESGMFVCRICGMTRFPNPGETEMMTALELKIRHDGEEGDT